MRVVEVDACDDRAFTAWHAVLEASLDDERPGEPHGTAVGQRERALAGRRPGSGRTFVLLAAVEGGRVTGAARLGLFARDNPHLADVLLHVHPDARRRGAGAALLAEAARRARAAGRTVLTAELDEPRDHVPGRAVARQAGATCRQVEVRRDLVLPVDAVRLDALERDALPHAEGYELLGWRGPVPDHLLDDQAQLLRAMSTEVPVGEMPHEQEQWDGARVRAHDELLLAAGRTWFTAAAAHGGQLVAFTDLGVLLDQPQRADQWSTLVLPGHRGHRLSTLLKIRTLRDLQAAFPQVRLLTTHNDATNAPMIAVNDALGYRPAGLLSHWALEPPVP